MKKKILFMLISMNVGGTERAFLNLLHELPKEEYEITVLLLQKKGGFLQEIPEHVTVKEMSHFPEIARNISYNPKEKIKKNVAERRYKQAFFLLSLHAYMKITKDRRAQFKKVFKNTPVRQEEFDIAVAYAGPMDIITYYIAMRVKAKEKYQWIHFDVDEIGFDFRFASKMYEHFDKIHVVSKTAATHLKEKLPPTFIHKISTQTNDVPVQMIRKLAEQENVFPLSTSLRIVTVGRVAKEKGPDIAVEILFKLKELGYDICWHWIGDGEWRSVIEKMIKDYGVEDAFILEGGKSNPYTYMNQCDIYVQPSRHEGYCLTLAEARVLEKPIVTTATAGGKEQIKHDKTGFISEINEQELLKNIIQLIELPELKNRFSKALQEENAEQEIQVHFKERNLHDEMYLSSRRSTI